MKEIQVNIIEQTVARLCQEANFYLGEDVVHALREAIDKAINEFKKRQQLKAYRILQKAIQEG